MRFLEKVKLNQLACSEFAVECRDCWRDWSQQKLTENTLVALNGGLLAHSAGLAGYCSSGGMLAQGYWIASVLLLMMAPSTSLEWHGSDFHSYSFQTSEAGSKMNFSWANGSLSNPKVNEFWSIVSRSAVLIQKRLSPPTTLSTSPSHFSHGKVTTLAFIIIKLIKIILA